MTRFLFVALLGCSPLLWAQCSPYIQSPRLADACLVRSLDGAKLTVSQYDNIMMRLARHGAYYGTEKKVFYATHNLGLTSYWDSYANGGTSSSKITLGNITLQSDPALVKKGDLIGAISYHFNSNLVFNEQSWFDLNYQAKYGAGLTTGHEINLNKLTLCTNLKLRDGLFLDECYSKATNQKSLSATTSKSKEVKLVYNLDGYTLITLGNIDSSSELANFLSISQATASGKLHEVRLDKSKVDNGFSANLAYGFFVSGSAYQASLSWKDYGLSWIMGYPKDQVVSGVGLSGRTKSGYDWLVNYQRSDSNIDFFKQSSMSFKFGTTVSLF